MSGWLLGSLEALGLALLAAAVVSILSTLWIPWIARLRSAVHRADAAFVLGIAPLTAAVALWLAVMLPALLAVTGIRGDHCDLHLHHPHLCALHAGGANGLLIAAGVAGALVLAWRVARLAILQVRANHTLAALERLGRVGSAAPYPVVHVPGSPWVCLAVGCWRQRVLISATITDHLTPAQVQAALAHEAAHLGRRDPLLTVLLAWAGLASVPFAAHRFQLAFAEAAEQASDALAAQSAGAVVVAESLVTMARLSRSAAPATSMAFGGSSLERRVVALLHGPPQTHPTRAAQIAFVTALTSIGVATLASDAIHHVVESLLQLFG